MAPALTRINRRLAALRAEYGPGRAPEKMELLRALARGRLGSARAVETLHETLCFLRAYPDDAALLSRVETMLEGFATRSDLKRQRKALADSGIAGTSTSFPFYPETALWLAERWPDLLEIEWEEFTREELVEKYLQFLALWSETPGLDEEPLSCREWLDRMKGSGETGATFLLRRLGAVKAKSVFLFQAMTEELELPLRLDPGPRTPSRTLARAPGRPRKIFFQEQPLARSRPDLRVAAATPPVAVRAVSVAQGRALIDLAREAMVTRARDLDAFQYGDPRDVRLIEGEEGYCLVAIGVLPERRLFFEGIYGFLTLKNGVPIGYVLNSALYGSAEIAYNVFDTYRGAEAARVYGFVLAAVHHLFGTDSFSIYPYQLGQDNEEAIESGAWWFYQKLGYRPREKRTLRLMESELARMRKRPGHRSSAPTLRKLADEMVFFHLGEERDDVIGQLAMSTASLRITEYLAGRFGSDRDRGEALCAEEAAARFGGGPGKGWSVQEKLAFRRWSPLLMLLGGVEAWSAAERTAAVAVVRAKGGRRESDFVRLFDGHVKLRAAVLALMRS